MIKQEFSFVEHSHGEMEGTVYNNVIVSDGLMALKLKNASQDSVVLGNLVEGDKVVCELSIKGSKTLVPKIDLLSIVKVVK